MPLVYCFEGIDQPGVNLTDLRLDPTAAFEVVAWPDRLGGIIALRTRGWLVDVRAWDDRLYGTHADRSAPAHEINLTAIPYFAWANREAGPMRVWLPQIER